jgi:hypothetical protein
MLQTIENTSTKQKTNDLQQSCYGFEFEGTCSNESTQILVRYGQEQFFKEIFHSDHYLTFIQTNHIDTDGETPVTEKCFTIQTTQKTLAYHYDIVQRQLANHTGIIVVIDQDESNKSQKRIIAIQARYQPSFVIVEGLFTFPHQSTILRLTIRIELISTS